MHSLGKASERGGISLGSAHLSSFSWEHMDGETTGETEAQRTDVMKPPHVLGVSSGDQVVKSGFPKVSAPYELTS